MVGGLQAVMERSTVRAYELCEAILSFEVDQESGVPLWTHVGFLQPETKFRGRGGGLKDPPALWFLLSYHRYGYFPHIFLN